MALTPADRVWLQQTVTATVNAAVVKILADTAGLADKIGDKANPSRTVGDALRDLAKLRGYLVGDPADTKNAAIPPSAPVAQMSAAAQYVLADGERNNAGEG